MANENIFEALGTPDKRGDMKFYSALGMIFNRVFAEDEKGMRRHGKGRPLFEQPAFRVRAHAPGFFTGQAMKKIIEGSEWEGDSAEDLTDQMVVTHQVEEYMDACSYLIFEMLYLVRQVNENEKGEKGLPLRNSTPEEDREEERPEEV